MSAGLATALQRGSGQPKPCEAWPLRPLGLGNCSNEAGRVRPGRGGASSTHSLTDRGQYSQCRPAPRLSLRRRRWQAGNSSTFPRLVLGGDNSAGQHALQTLAALTSSRYAAPGSIKLVAAAFMFGPQVSCLQPAPSSCLSYSFPARCCR